MSVNQLLLATVGAGAAIGVYHQWGFGYDGITNGAELKLIDILGGAVVAALINYYFGQSLDMTGVVIALIEGGAGVAYYRTLVLAKVVN